MTYQECKKIAIDNNIKSASEWFSYSKGDENIPYHPERIYKNKGWIDWFSFLNKSKDQRKYNVDDNFFKKINRESAYILGFWAADGCIRKTQFSITQNVKDVYILERILDIMKSNNPLITHNINNMHFNIYSQEITTDIKNIFGHFNSKTFDLKFPKIDNKYLPDFIRGFFDGDGCITYQKNEKCYIASIISASSLFINELFKVLNKNIEGFNGKLNIKNGYYNLTMGVNDTRRFGKYIYQDLEINSLYLRRKKERFDLSGEIRIATFNKKFISYNDAKIIIKNLGIKTYREWRRYKKDNKVENIPSNMEYYKQYKGWKEFIN